MEHEIKTRATGLGVYLILEVPLLITHIFLLECVKRRRTLFPRQIEKERRLDRLKLH